MRPRHPGQRTASGRLSRAKPITAVEPTIAFRARQAVALGLADPEWGSILGQLFLTGRVSASQYMAAKAYGKLVRDYRRIIDAPEPKAAWLLPTPSVATAIGKPAPPADPATIIHELDRIRETIPHVTALDALIIDDRHDSPSIPDVCVALTALIARWGVKIADEPG